MSRGRALSVAKPKAGSGLKDETQRNKAVKMADRQQRKAGKEARKVQTCLFSSFLPTSMLHSLRNTPCACALICAGLPSRIGLSMYTLLHFSVCGCNTELLCLRVWWLQLLASVLRCVCFDVSCRARAIGMCQSACQPSHCLTD